MVQTVDPSDLEVPQIVGYRPMVANAEKPTSNFAKIITPNNLQINSQLRESEWVSLDEAIIEAARYPLKGINDLRSSGLTVRIGSLGVFSRQWYMSSDVTRPTVSMTGQARNLDRVDFKTASAPIPFVRKDFTFDARTLEASRRMGSSLEVSNATEASRVVAEEMEKILFNGASNIVVNGAPLYGYLNHPNRNTDTAGNYGGGDWGTIGNILPTVVGMITALQGDGHYGPYRVYIAQTQFNQAAFSFYGNDSNISALSRILSLPGVQSADASPELADGQVLVVQMTRDVIEWADALDIQVREWTSGDGLTSNFAVLAVGAPLVKAKYGGQSGIAVATGA